MVDGSDRGRHALSLATVLVLRAKVVGLTAEPTAAESESPSQDNGVRCCLLGPAVSSLEVEGYKSDDHELYVPGGREIDIDAQGNRRLLGCMPDGTWKEDKALMPAAPAR
jgi:hypothetical protein